MSEPRAQRTLVKSPPELWAEISDLSTLARHLGEFGEIRITRLEAETTVVWEGDRARGTVELEPSGWGTKVTLTAEPTAPEPGAVEEPEAVEEPAPAPEPEAEPEPEPEAAAETAEPVATIELDPAPGREPEPRRGFFARLFRRRRQASVAAPTPSRDDSASDTAAQSSLDALEAEADAATAPVPAPEPPAAEAAPEPESAPEPEPAPEPLDDAQVEAVLVGVLDDLGAAHHRPFSRG